MAQEQRDFSYGLGNVVEATKSAGAQLGGILRDRLNQKQYDDFLAGPNKDFTQRLREAQDLLLDESNPDAPSQGVKMLHGAMQTYMDEAAKYPENPLVAQRAKQAFDMNMSFLQQEFVMMHQKAAGERAKTKMAMDFQGKQIEAVGTMATAEKNVALAGKYEAETGKIVKQTTPYFSGAPGSIQGYNDDARADSIWNTIEGSLSRPRTPTERAQVDIEMNDIRTRRAQARLAELAGRGEKREVVNKDAIGGKEIRPYSVTSKADLDAVAQTIDPQEIRAEWILNTAKREASVHQIDPNVFDRKYGTLVDPTKASTFNPISRAVPEQTVGKILFGVGGWSALSDPETKAEPKTVFEAIERLPEQLDHVSGPMADLFKQIPTIAADENIKTMADLKMQLWLHGKEIIDKTFGDREEYGNLDEGMKKNREAAGHILQAMTRKYANQIAARMGIAVPSQPQVGVSDKELGESAGFGRLFGAVGAGAGKIKRLISEYEE